MATDCLWGPPPAVVTLSGREVHVWCGSLDQPAGIVHRLAQALSAAEQARADRFHFEKHRRRYVVSQGQLRAILGRYLDLEPGQLEFQYSHLGKPALAQTLGGQPLAFNMSHSHELALYAVTCGRDVGVDLEYVRPISDAEQIVERYFTDREKAAFRALPPEQKLEAFCSCWTRKEAFLKATGKGLYRPLDDFAVSLAPGEPAQLLYVKGDPAEASRWSLHALAPVSGYVAALATQGHEWDLACWQWVD